MKGIIAVNNLGFIGLNNELPWRSRDDFRHFKALTADSTCIVGWNTLQTLPHLKGRNIILSDRLISVSSTEPSRLIGCYSEFKWSIERDRYELYTTSNTTIYPIDWCIGGKKTYERYCDRFSELHISHIDDNTIGDTLFPDLSNLNPECNIFNYHFGT